MLRHFIKPVAIIILFTATAGAQIVPGDSPNMGIGAAVSNSRSRPLLGISSGSAERRLVFPAVLHFLPIRIERVAVFEADAVVDVVALEAVVDRFAAAFGCGQ